MIKQEHLSRKIRKRYQRFVDIVFLAISLVRAIVSQVMRLMEHFGISGLTDTLKRIISNAVFLKVIAKRYEVYQIERLLLSKRSFNFFKNFI